MSNARHTLTIRHTSSTSGSAPMRKHKGPDWGGPDRGRVADLGETACVVVLRGRPLLARGGRAGHPGGGAMDRLWRPTRYLGSLAEADAWLEEQLDLALADHVANGSLYLWTDRGCAVG